MIKKITLDKKDFFNGFIIASSSLISPISFLILTPIFINYLGLEKYGVWILIFSLSNFLRISTFGIDTSITHFVAKNSSYKKKKIFINNNFLILFFLFGLAFFFLFFLIQISNHIPFFKNNDNYEIIKNSITFAIIFTFINIYQNNLYSIMNGLEKFNVSFFLTLISKIIILILQIFLLISGFQIKEILLFSSIILLFITILETFYINLYYINFFNFFFKKIDLKISKIIFDYTKYISISSVISILNSNVDKLFVTHILGLKNLVYYSISYSIFQLIHTLYGSFFKWMIPKISKFNKLNMKVFFNKLNLVIIILAILSLLIIKLISPLILSLWLDKNYNVILISYIDLFLIINFIFVLSIPINNFLISLELTKNLYYFNLINFILFAFFMIILGNIFDVYGIIIARLAMIFALIYGYKKIIKILK